jgi:hypothetical protein
LARTTTERQISRSRKADQILVPLIEQRLRHPVNIDDGKDADFMHDLMLKQADREEERAERNYYSPSQLASCLRQVYLSRHHKQLEIVPVKQTRIEPNFYFLTGDWLHLKWQFVLYKMDKEGTEGFKLIDCEVPVASKRGDHGGTIDAVCEINGEWVAVDFKGLNVRDAGKAARGDVDLKYKIQLADYLILWNSTLREIQQLSRGLLIVENKGGPDPNHPIALSEISVYAKDHKPEVQWRLETLRAHEKAHTIPEPSCQSVSTLQFQGCPFRKFCREEVQAIQKRNAKSRDTTKLRVASPNGIRAARARGNT